MSVILAVGVIRRAVSLEVFGAVVSRTVSSCSAKALPLGQK